MQRLAVIDIGTLKVKFLIASVNSKNEIKEIYASSTLTCFGCDLEKNKGNVIEENLVKTIKELKRCRLLLKIHAVEKYRVISTHAMRKAKNRKGVIVRIKDEVGFDVENISQEEEAKLFFSAVMRTFEDKKKDYALVDVGGGSVQVLVGNSKGLKSSYMMQTGAAFLHGNFTSNSDNPKSFTTKRDIEKMKSKIIEELINLDQGLGIPLVYGSTNIIDLMKAIGIPLSKYKDSKSHPYKTYAKYLEKFVSSMLPLNYDQRESKFNFQKGYMWGVDKAFLNVILLSKHLKSPYIIPSNANIAQGFILSMVD